MLVRNVSLLITALSLSAAGAWAQAGGSINLRESKIATLDLQRAIVTTAEGKKASAQLQNKFVGEQNELRAIQKQLQDLQNRITTSHTLSDTELARLQRQAELLTRQFQRKQDGLNESVDAAQSDVVANIAPRMQNIIERYARENGYTLVLNTSSPGTPVVYGGNQRNITDDIIRLFDQSYPVKVAGNSSAGLRRADRP